jgi:transcriptional regulator with XRE-family HTH domain
MGSKKISIGNKVLGERLALSRQNKGLNQKELAQLLGYKNGVSISNIESGKTPIDGNSLIKIAENLDVDLHWLITGKSSPEALKWEENYKKVLTRLADYIVRGLADCLELKATRQQELEDNLRRQKRGEKVDIDFIGSLQSEVLSLQREISEFSKDKPWLEQCINILEISDQSNAKSADTPVKIGKDKKIRSRILLGSYHKKS